MTPRSLARAASVVRASTVEGLRDLTDLDRGVTVPMPLRRRISILSLQGGVGCSTVALEIATMLSALRGETIRVIDAQAGSPQPEPPPSSDLEVLRLPASAWPAGIPSWQRLLDAQPSRKEMTITDWGATPIAAIRSIGAVSHAICIVAPATRDGIEQSAVTARALDPEVPTAVCVVDLHRTAASATSALLQQIPVPTLFLRSDPRRVTHRELPRPLTEKTAYDLHVFTARLMTMVVTPRVPPMGEGAS